MSWEPLLVRTLESSKHLYVDWLQDDDLRALQGSHRPGLDRSLPPKGAIVGRTSAAVSGPLGAGHTLQVSEGLWGKEDRWEFSGHEAGCQIFFLDLSTPSPHPLHLPTWFEAIQDPLFMLLVASLPVGEI